MNCTTGFISICIHFDKYSYYEKGIFEKIMSAQNYWNSKYLKKNCIFHKLFHICFNSQQVLLRTSNIYICSITFLSRRNCAFTFSIISEKKQWNINNKSNLCHRKGRPLRTYKKHLKFKERKKKLKTIYFIWQKEFFSFVFLFTCYFFKTSVRFVVI